MDTVQNHPRSLSIHDFLILAQSEMTSLNHSSLIDTRCPMLGGAKFTLEVAAEEIKAIANSSERSLGVCQ
jgi:hypothetical protein